MATHEFFIDPSLLTGGISHISVAANTVRLREMKTIGSPNAPTLHAFNNMYDEFKKLVDLYADLLTIDTIKLKDIPDVFQEMDMSNRLLFGDTMFNDFGRYIDPTGRIFHSDLSAASSVLLRDR